MESWFITLDVQTFLVGFVFLLIAIWLKDRRTNMPPGPFQWPIFGSLPDMVLRGKTDPIVYLRDLAKEYGGLFTVKFGEKRIVCISDYSIMKEALVKQGDVFSTRPAMEEVRKGLRKSDAELGIVFSNGGVWQTSRRFAMQVMRDFGVGKKSLEEKIQIEAGVLAKEFEKENGQAHNPNLSTQMAVTNIICSIIFGERSVRHFPT
jgi:cytochrome P450